MRARSLYLTVLAISFIGGAAGQECADFNGGIDGYVNSELVACGPSECQECYESCDSDSDLPQCCANLIDENDDQTYQECEIGVVDPPCALVVHVPAPAPAPIAAPAPALAPVPTSGGSEGVGSDNGEESNGGDDDEGEEGEEGETNNLDGCDVGNPCSAPVGAYITGAIGGFLLAAIVFGLAIKTNCLQSHKCSKSSNPDAIHVDTRARNYPEVGGSSSAAAACTEPSGPPLQNDTTPGDLLEPSVRYPDDSYPPPPYERFASDS